MSKALVWASNQKYAVALNNTYPEYQQGGFPNTIAISNTLCPVLTKEEILKDKAYYGCIGYDFKNQLEDLYSDNPSLLTFPDFFFFEPEVLLEFEAEHVYITAQAPDQIMESINHSRLEHKIMEPSILQALTSEQAYLQNMKDLISHIHKGNLYEINYCVAFSGHAPNIDPVTLYMKLLTQTQVPFACMVKYSDQYLVCASPERYFKTEGSKVISQPMKGTARVVNNTEQERLMLQQSAKERNENVMIVDLVRNDLSKVCSPGSVQVEELYGVYQFGHLYQMVSTIGGSLPEGLTWLNVVEASFPMGSMTGAPKYKSLQLIENYENFRRNIYAGSVGYIKKNGDADFNVVIRSIFYDATSGRVSFAVGSGVTAMSVPELEYQECLLKAESMIKVLS